MVVFNERSNVYNMFKLLHNEIMNQFDCSIKTVRSDNALKNMQSSFDIINQTACAHTS